MSQAGEVSCTSYLRFLPAEHNFCADTGSDFMTECGVTGVKFYRGRDLV